MAEKRTRRYTFSIEDAIENSLAQPSELDLGLASYSPEGAFAAVAEEVVEESDENVNNCEEDYEDEFFDDEPEESEDEFFDEEPEESVEYLDEEETQEFRRPEARRIYRRPVRTDDANEETEVKSKTSAVEKVKTFFKQSVVPLFVETEEVTVENDEFEDVIPDAEYEETVDASENANEGFLNRAANFFNSKVINPIKEKFADDEEEYVEENQESTCEERRESLHVIDNRRSLPIDAEYSDVEGEEDEVYYEEEEPGFFRRILDRFVNPDDDFDDEVDYEEEEDEPGLLETVRGFFASRKNQNVDEEEVVYEETAVTKKDSGTKFSDRLMKLFYDDTVDVEDEESYETVEESDSEEEEDYSSFSVPDPKIYAEIMKEKEEEREALNKK